MSRLEPFKNLSLGEAARQLSIHPFDLVRLLAANDALPGDLRIDPGRMEMIRELGGIEDWWSEGPTLPTGDGRAEALLRGACGHLVERGIVGDNATRMDNLLRGLSGEDQLTVRGWVKSLTTAGLMSSANTPAGIQVSLVEGREYAVADIAQGGEIPPTLEL